MGDLKDYRKKEIPMLILGDILVLLYMLKVFDVSILSKGNEEWLGLILNVLNSTVLSSLLYLFTMILDGVFSADTKYRLVYFFLKRLPAETVFSNIRKKNTDKRFSYTELKKSHAWIYDNMPEDKHLRYEHENNEWYKLLKKHEEDGRVFQSHRESLMFRDMHCCNLIILALYLFLSLVFEIVQFNWRYVVFLIVLTLVLNIAARNKIKRFVYNVIASEIS